jgi:MFS transporter, MHS family, shikimate and dehydroshikimate transport protein
MDSRDHEHRGLVEELGGEDVHVPTPVRKVALASFIGTTVEWYDYFIYGTAAALVFGPQFFPEFSPLASTLAAFSTFAVGFLARPVGGVVFGHLGDRIGRKVMLVVSLLVMGLATVAIGLLPTYASIGVVAPILLVALRFIQGFAVGGEWGGAVLMTIEHSPREKRGLYGSFPQLGKAAGILLANAAFLSVVGALSQEQFAAWGWRVPFLLSIVLIAIGLYIRLRIEESPVFRQVRETQSEARMPIVDVFRTYPREVFLAGGACITTIAMGYLVQVYMLSYATQTLGLANSTILTIVVLSAVIELFAVMGLAALSDRVGRRKVFMSGTILGALWALPFFWLIDTGSLVLIAIAMVVMMIIASLMYGPMAALFAEMFGTRVRYSGASVGYQIGSIIGGALTPIVATSLFAATGTSTSISVYMIVLCVISFVSIFLITETYQKDLGEVDVRERELLAGAGDGAGRSSAG